MVGLDYRSNAPVLKPDLYIKGSPTSGMEEGPTHNFIVTNPSSVRNSTRRNQVFTQRRSRQRKMLQYVSFDRN